MANERNSRRIQKNRRNTRFSESDRRNNNRDYADDERERRRNRNSERKAKHSRNAARTNRGSERSNHKSALHPSRTSTMAILITSFVVIICVFMASKVFDFLNTTHITPYEVKIGSLAINNTYKGVILRQEEIIKAEKSGYINFYTKEGEKVSNGAMVYTIDSTGKLSELIGDNYKGENSLTKDDLLELKYSMASFASDFDRKRFSDMYDFKDNVESSVLKFANYKILSGIDTLKSANYADSVKFGNAPVSGVLVYDIDGYEKLEAESIDESRFDESQYVINKFHTGDLVGEGDDAYKLITSEDWSIVIEIDEEREEQLRDESYVEVRFLENGYKSWGKISTIHQGDNIFLKLDFNNSMITFATERFIDIELLINTEEGLKIPRSAIVEKALYVIPSEYYIEDGPKGNPGFMRKCMLEDGTYSTEFIEIPADVDDQGNCYVEESLLNRGDELLKENSSEIYSVGNQAIMTGVYNINKGYAEFKGIEVLNQNEEYAIVKSTTEYGLSVYDHIALKGDSVNEDDFIY